MLSSLPNRTASNTARTFADNVASCFAALTSRCSRGRKAATESDTTETVAVANNRVTEPAATCVDLLTPRATLPNEMWGEIASFSVREDILNLRTTCHHIRSEADRTVTTMTVTGPDDLYALANSSGFDHIKALRLYAVDDASLYYFGRFSPLLQRPQPPTLSLIIQQNDIATRQGAEILRGLPLAGLKLICLHNLNHHTVEALKNASYPIELVGIFSNAELASLARIPMLTALDSASEKFSDEAVALMATHPALQTLSIRAFQTMSDMGIQRLAGMPQLTQLSLYETDYMSSRMTATGVIALAACKTLTSLRIRTSVTPLSENSVVALSSSTSLQTLDISIGPGVGHLANLATLQDLVLRGQCLGSRALDVASARALGRMSHLKSLSIANARIDPTALTAFVEHSRIGTLHLQDVLLGQDAVSAMVNNHHLTTLTLQTVVITAEQIVALSSHPTLEKLRINHTDYRPQHQFDRTIAYV